jgi:Icc-related predicted phosphoesterase
MKIVCISDTHCRLRKVVIPEGELLIHAGDLTFKGDIHEINQELIELGSIAKNFKYGCPFIAGNHDWLGERNSTLMKQIALDNGLIYLDHSSVQINGFNIFGSAYTPEFCNWAFNVPRGQPLKEKWAQIPDNTDILITHGPPYGILDTVLGRHPMKHLGCEELSSRVNELKQLKLHVFGHIHDSYGQTQINGVNYVNASTSTENYKPINKPIVVEL